jgi:hypothetical protein
VEWLFGRDGSLTARDGNGRWIGDTSLPRRVALAMLKKLQCAGTVACFLAPPHAAFIRVALEKLQPQQAIVAIIPDERDLAMILHCDDFAADIAAGRIWFAAGADWRAELARLFESQPGLPTPSQFIRLPSADANTIDPMIAAAQAIFADTAAARAQGIRSLPQQPPRREKLRLCVIAPSRFRLWQDGGVILGELARTPASNMETLVIDPDRPTSAAPLLLARTAAQCDALLTADITRADRPGIVADSLPWITWHSRGPIPAAPSAAASDHLIVCDDATAAAARSAGWPAERVHVGAPPVAQVTEAQENADPFIAIVADTSPLDMPESLRDFSSHRLLWEMIAEQLTRDALALGRDPSHYLSRAMRQLNIADASFPAAAFVERLIVPAYQQGLARLLITAKIPVRLFGDGWEKVAELRPHAAGPVISREQLHQILTAARGVVHVWPDQPRHPIAYTGGHVIESLSQTRDQLINAMRRALVSAPVHRPTAPPLSLALVQSILTRGSGA